MTIDTAPPRPSVAPATRALGFAGLLPQLAILAACLVVPQDGTIRIALPFAALVYGGVILSFLGGIWWGFAMRRGQGQGFLAALSVLPSLVAAGLMAMSLTLDVRWLLVMLGSAILLTLPVDRRLATTGEAPDGWMRLRAPLSLGLGGLTILTGALPG
ncbi:MAG: DUF3429 domain-containing protein [Sphingomonas sp.]